MTGVQQTGAVQRWARFSATLAGVSALAIAAVASMPTEAMARKKQQEQGFFNFFDAPAPKPYRVYNKRRTGTGTNTGGDESAKAQTKKEQGPAKSPVKGPLVITISLGQQRLTVHDIDGPIAEAPISSGTAAYPTFQGVFTILEKSVVHHSNIYSGAPMPNMQRITWSGTAMHAGALPGYPASHGCIRLPYNFSKHLYGLTKLGTRVVVTRDAIAPKPISHANLIAPLPPESSAVATGSTETATEPRSYETVRSSIQLITTASAAETHAPMPASTEPLTGYRAKRAAERQKTEDDLRTAEAAKIEAELTAKASVQASDAAKLAAKEARMEAARLANEAGKAEQARVAGDRELESFSRKYVSQKPTSEEELKKATDTEQQLEDKTIELGKGLDAAREAAAKAKEAVAEADAKVLAAVAKVKEDAQKYAKINQDMKTAAATLDSFRKQDAARKHPVSVFISRSLGRLFVRQGYVPIFDMPVAIKEPTVAIGTHVFTAIEQTGPTEMRWSSTSIPYNSGPTQDSKKKKRNPNYDVAPQSTHLPQTPQSALDRIEIPEEARERIADVMKPGSSIVVSDYGISHQTGPFTDFIILTR